MEEKKVCELCNGTGFIKSEEGVEFCICRYTEEDINKLLKIPRRFWNAEIDNYRAESPSEQNALKEAMLYAATFKPGEGKGLTFIGPPGVGKTHLAVGILKQVYRRHGIKGAFYDTKDLIYKFKALMETGKFARAVRVVLNKELIVLDDLGSEMLSDWQRELISYIITYRYNNLKSTIITTNFSLEDREDALKEFKKFMGREDIEIPKYTLSERLGSSVVSRIFEMNRTVYIEGRDRRRLRLKP